MEGVGILLVITIPICLIGFVYCFGDRIWDAFSPVNREYGVVETKEYITPKSKIIKITRRRDLGPYEFQSSTMQEDYEEVQIPEKCVLHIRLNRTTIATPVSSEVFDSVNRGDQILVKYSRGRFSNHLYLKKVGGV